jgi:pyruvate/2-oxoglutarate dehydrogenase complex dihydrolipoamide acyltransferase (E2) component
VRVSVKMPKLGLTMTEATILEWRKVIGERVSPGETLLVIETEKAEVEVESPAGGTVVEILGASGTTRPVGDVIAIIEA